MAKGKNCRISNCKNILKSNGTICGTHKWRKKKFNSYDLPSYTGIPNYYIENKLPEGIVKFCEKHGYLTEEETYKQYHKNKISSYPCKKCMSGRTIKSKYIGMKGIECYENLSIKQNHVCAICKLPNMTKRNNKIKRMAIDHNHSNGNIRGLLCGFCNSLLGYAKDNIEILESAIKYLRESEK